MTRLTEQCSIWRGRSCVAVAVLSLSLVVASPIVAQKPRISEYEVKAADLYQFGKFVQWPDGSTIAGDGPFFVCVMGQDPFGRTLDAVLTGEMIGGKSVVAKHVSKAQEAWGCRILFISPSEEKDLGNILASIDGYSALTVSEIPGFARRGGMIQLLSEGNRVRFEINLTAAQNAGLALSSELLKLAVAIRRTSQPGD